MTTAFRRAAVAESALRRTNEGLETRVVESTTELNQRVVEEAAEVQIRQMQKIAPDPTIAILPKPFTLAQPATKIRDVIDRTAA